MSAALDPFCIEIPMKKLLFALKLGILKAMQWGAAILFAPRLRRDTLRAWVSVSVPPPGNALASRRRRQDGVTCRR